MQLPCHTGNALATGFLLLLSVLLLALISYRASDPSLNTAGATAVHNWTCRLGPSTSDLLLQLEGAAVFASPSF